MYYGKFGLANYTKSILREINDSDILDYFYAFPLEKEDENIVFACKKSIFAVYSSIWRMIAKPIMNNKHPEVSHFDFAKRRVEAVYLDDLLPNIYTSKAWIKRSDFLLNCLSAELKQLGAVCRSASIRLIIQVPQTKYLDGYTSKILLKLWKYMGYPKQSDNIYTSHRFFLHVASLPGNTIEDKTKYLSKFPKLHDKLCLVACEGDMDFYGLLHICKAFKYKVRPCFDIETRRDKYQKRISIKSKEWKVFENYWRTSKNGSIMLPVVFCSKPIEEENSAKLLKHYIRRASVVFCPKPVE